MKLICIGRNYAAHAAELNDGAELPKEPLFFLKPDTALLRNNDPFYIPAFSNEVHYECELVVRITRLAKCMDVKFASAQDLSDAVSYENATIDSAIMKNYLMKRREKYLKK